LAAEPIVYAVISGNIYKVVAKRGGGSTKAGPTAAVVVAAVVVVAIPTALPPTSSPSSYSLY